MASVDHGEVTVLARLFIGIWLNAALRDEVVRFVETVRQDICGFKWTPPEQLHFTLKFLGEVKPEDSVRLTANLREVAAQIGEFTLALGAPGCFPHAGKPRIVWLGLAQGGQAVRSLAASVEAVCVENGFPADDKPFRPHLTIARARPDCPFQINFPSGTGFEKAMIVQSFSLIESKLTPTGPIYQTVAEFPLKKS
ncbi:MAG TPA: RNA 2',3'-cyclic phosphodiesterase [Bacillota bacterium]|nr:RNA 2',3'-cyclic phosphodiesterase [Bacillota bacterium]